MINRVPVSTDEDRVQASIIASKRLETLRHSQLLDSAPEECFDRLTRLAAKLLGVPSTFISLVDEQRDFYKSSYGFDEPLTSRRQMEGRTFCHYTLLSTDPLVLSDVTEIPQVREVPTIESLGVRAYMGIPLVATDGSVLGSFCAIDYKARNWTEVEIEIMQELAQSTIREIDLRLAIRGMVCTNAMLSAIMESAPYSIISTDKDGLITTFNKTAERMLWYTAEDMIGKTPALLHEVDEIAAHSQTLSQELGYAPEVGMQTLMAKANAGLQDDKEWTYIRKDGSRFPVRLVVTALKDIEHNVIGYLGIAYDISDEKRAKEYIQHISLHDALTGLPNRILLNDRVTMAIAQHQRSKQPFALGMIDVDHFKHINDAMGHHIGDSLLQELTLRLKSCLRTTDTLARMGGDEFVVLLSDTNLEMVNIIADRIRNILKKPMNGEAESSHQLTVSMGFSFYPTDATAVNDLLRCADMAMYLVKKQGRNGYKVYDPSMDAEMAYRAGIEKELSLALRNNGFVLHYQPEIDLETGRMLGVEALLRLPLNSGGFLSPAEFIPLAEELGMIIPIGQWVLETACRDMQRLSVEFHSEFTVAVNISPRQFADGNLTKHVHAALSESGLKNAQLALEITEGLFIDNPAEVLAILQEIVTSGIGIALDDFGTGYSSLSYLKRYPISLLKIDQSFVRDLTLDKESNALILAIIAMGHSLGMKVIAEGVENQAQFDFLLANHCDQCQGYYIGRPMPYEALRLWLTNAQAGINNQQ